MERNKNNGLARWLVWLLVFSLLFGTVGTVQAEGDFEIAGDTLVKYIGSDTEVTVPDGIKIIGESAFDGSGVTTIHLPDTLTTLDNYCFGWCNSLEEITLPKSVDSISDGQVFAYNRSLKAIHVDPENEKYKSVDGVLFTKDGSKLMYYPAGKPDEEYSIPEGTTMVGQSSFSDANIRSMYIPASCTQGIEENANLNGLTSLETIEVDEDHPTFAAEKGMLLSKDGKRLIVFPSAYEATEMNPEDFPAGLEELNSWAFMGSGKLRRVILPDTLKKIGWMCFDGSEKLEEVYVPASVEEIGGAAFSLCRALKKLTIEGQETVLDARVPITRDTENVTIVAHKGSPAEEYAKDQGISFVDLDDADAVAKLDAANQAGKPSEEENPGSKKTEEQQETISSEESEPEPVTEKEPEAPQEEPQEAPQEEPQEKLQEAPAEKSAPADEDITENQPQFEYTLETDESSNTYAVITGGRASRDMIIPATIDGYKVRKVGFMAFDNADAEEKIETLVIENGITELEKQAFMGCKHLTSVKLPNSLKKIGMYAFRDCQALQTVEFPANMTIEGVDYGAFWGVSLDDLILPDGTSLAEASKTGNNDVFATGAEGWYYKKLDDGTVRITEWGDYNWQAKEVTIPQYLNGMQVTELAKHLLLNHSNVKKLTLPEGLKVIEDMAFCSCVNLTEVNLPDSLERVGSGAFADIGAKELQLPENARKLSDVFWYCSRIKLDSTGQWEYGLLEDGTAVIAGFTSEPGTLTFPTETDGIPVTMIARVNRGKELNWEMMSGITKVVIPEGIKAVCYNGLAYCNNLTEVELPEGLEIISEGAFTSCPLTSVQLPSSLKKIGKNAFNQHQIKEIVIPAGVQSIGPAAFRTGGDQYPEKVTFEGMTTELGKGVFGYSYQTYSENPDDWTDDYASPAAGKKHTIALFCYPGSTADFLYQYNVKKTYFDMGPDSIRTAPADPVLKAGTYQPDEMIYELIIPEGVEEIADGALSGLRTLCKVKIPSTLTRIGAHAFEGCSALSGISLPKKGMTMIGEAAFKDCVSLTAINLGDGITEIPDSAFENCIRLSKASLPSKGLLRIGNNAFQQCGKLTALNLPNGLEEIGEFAFAYTGLAKVKIPDTVTKVGKAAFIGTAITSLTLPKEMEEIPEQFSKGAVNLSNVTFPKTVMRIGNEAFTYCPLKGLKLPEGLISIGEYAFAQNPDAVKYFYAISGGKKSFSGVKTMKLPASLETIGEGAFYGFDALTEISFTKDSALKEIGDYAFALCTHLKTLLLPDSARTIGKDAFINCMNLTKADLGNGLNEIGDEAFIFNDGLVVLIVPDTVTAIGTDILKGHGAELTVICSEGSAMEKWLKEHEPEVIIQYP